MHELLRVGSLKLDLARNRATYRGRELALAPSPAAILARMMREPTRTFAPGELSEGSPGSVRNAISLIRNGLGVDVIRTVGRSGYQLNAAAAEAGERPLLQAGDLELYPGGVLQRGTRIASLPLDQFAVLECAMRKAGGLATDEQIAQALGIDADGVSGPLANRLRRTLAAVRAKELLVRVLGKGYRLAATPGLRRVIGLELDLRALEARLHGRPLDLAPRQFDVLERLTWAPGTTVSRDDLLDIAAGEPLSAIIAALQHAIGADRLETTGSGYRLPVERFGILARGPLVLDPEAKVVRLGTREVQLLGPEARVLAALIRAGGDGITPQRLVTEAGLGSISSLRTRISTLRRKLHRLSDGELIEPGYRLAVELLDGAVAPAHGRKDGRET